MAIATLLLEKVDGKVEIFAEVRMLADENGVDLHPESGAVCLSLKKVDSQQARNNVYLSNTEEGAVL